VATPSYVIQEKRPVTAGGVLVTASVVGKGESARYGVGVAIEVSRQGQETCSGVTISRAKELERSVTESRIAKTGGKVNQHLKPVGSVARRQNGVQIRGLGSWQQTSGDYQHWNEN